MVCAIYGRLSKEDEEKQESESESIQNQKSMLVRYAVEHNWDIYGLYFDENYSGIDSHRPGFNRMLKDAEAGRFQIVLCKTQSRFTRDMELVEKYIHGKFPLWGIRFVAVADNIDTDIKGNKKARQINGLINEWYLEDLSENIRMVFDDKRRKGQYIGGHPIYGYLLDPNDKHKLIVDEEAAPVVRQIYDWYLAGNGAQHIAYLLNERGYDNPTIHKQKLGMTNTNASGIGSPIMEHGLWNKISVARILHNEMYTGVMIQGRRKKASYKSNASIRIPEERWFKVPNTHEAIIDPETFRRAQEMLRPRVRSDGSGKIHMLAGLVKCADCGSTMSKTSNGNHVSYLRCRLSIASGGRAFCTRHAIRLDRLIEFVADRLREHITEYYVPGNLNRFSVKKKPDDRTELLQKELRSLEEKIGKRSMALKNLYLDKVSGLIDEAQFISMNREFLAEKETMTKRQVVLQKELDSLEIPGENRDGLVQRIQELMKFDPMPRELFVMAIERIEIGEKDLNTGQQEVHIRWKF